MKKIQVVLSITFFIIVTACNQQVQPKKQEQSIMYEPTPLALLMLKMHGDALSWKGAIENENFQATFPKDYYGIYTVEATDPAVRNEVFIERTDQYLASVEELLGVEKKIEQVEKFNLVISACVDCHAIFCQGPIDKIEKLYFADAD